MHPREFVPNHIDFRISTAKSISHFKTAQGFILDQLSYNPYHTFSNIAKEILLLKYDVWFDFIVELEQCFLVNYDSASKEELLEIAVKLSDKRVPYYMSSLRKEFTDTTSREYINKWDIEHKNVYEYFVKEIRSHTTESPHALYRAIIYDLTKVMNHTIYELQELDIVLFGENTPSFNIDDVCYKINKDDPNYLIKKLHRYQDYRKGSFTKINLKNQTSSDVSIVCKIWLGKLEDVGVTYTIS